MTAHASGIRPRQAAFATFVIVLAACGNWDSRSVVLEPTNGPSQAAPTVTPDAQTPIASAPSAPPETSPSPDATSEASAEPIGSLRFPFANREMEVVIVGPPGIVVAWRGATDTDLNAVQWGGATDIALGRISDRELVLEWVGTVCDSEATLTVQPRSLVVTPSPRPGCDAMAVGRGVVLTYAAPVDPAEIEVRLLDTVLLPEPT